MGSDSCVFSWGSSSVGLRCLTFMGFFCLILFYFVPYFIFVASRTTNTPRTAFCSNERQKHCGSRWVDGEAPGGVEEGETQIRMYCVRRESIFNNGKNA